MSAFPDWEKYAVHQRREDTGCIPTAYEMLLRAADAKGIDFVTFQDDFDLDQNGGLGKNHFVSVGEAVKRKYPSVEFAYVHFQKGKGSEKLARVEEMILKKKPVLVSLALTRNGGWHIMPVVDSNYDFLIFLHHLDKVSGPNTQSVLKSEFIHRHDNWMGGEEIAYLTKC